MNKLYYKLLWLFPIALIPTTGLIAQEDDGDIVTLSPFEVDESTDIGYSATSTLAEPGSIPIFVTSRHPSRIVNEEFLEDTASTNIADVLLLTANTEISGPNGNFSGYQSTAGSPIPGRGTGPAQWRHFPDSRSRRCRPDP